jgi:hypothetical protein
LDHLYHRTGFRIAWLVHNSAISELRVTPEKNIDQTEIRFIWSGGSDSTKLDGTHWTVVGVGAGKESQAVSNDVRWDGIIIQRKMVFSTTPILRSTG